MKRGPLVPQDCESKWCFFLFMLIKLVADSLLSNILHWESRYSSLIICFRPKVVITKKWVGDIRGLVAILGVSGVWHAETPRTRKAIFNEKTCWITLWYFTTLLAQMKHKNQTRCFKQNCFKYNFIYLNVLEYRDTPSFARGLEKVLSLRISLVCIPTLALGWCEEQLPKSICSAYVEEQLH